MSEASSHLRGLARSYRAGRPTALISVCSAHPLVLEAALRHGAASGQPVLIEATCNQVNQDGGYTGLTPDAFQRQVTGLAAACNLPLDRLVLGGDHLGPNPWTALPAEAAMAKADTMVEAYVAAGFDKLHLDTSMPCADDPATLAEELIASRAARLASVAEAAAIRLGRPAPLYVIGTEVPPPGGAHGPLDALTPTTPENARGTVSAHLQAFTARGIAAAMDRVIAIVVQPGVEFGTENVIPYAPQAAHALVATLDDMPGLVFEAHSTDYQSRTALTALVRDGFAILKVGPGLTFALREALYRLDAMAHVLAPAPGVPSLAAVMERIMLDDPKHWSGHYHGDSHQLRLARHYSYSDRVRYYWSHPDAMDAVAALTARLDGVAIPETLISQFFPALLERVRSGAARVAAHELLVACVGDVLDTYAAAARGAGLLRTGGRDANPVIPPGQVGRPGARAVPALITQQTRKRT